MAMMSHVANFLFQPQMDEDDHGVLRVVVG